MSEDLLAGLLSLGNARGATLKNRRAAGYDRSQPDPLEEDHSTVHVSQVLDALEPMESVRQLEACERFIATAERLRQASDACMRGERSPILKRESNNTRKRKGKRS